MIIERLEVENFGPFCGKHSFDLTPVNSRKAHRPLIIFGGRNGTGKTTLFESIKICLYGDYFRGRRMPKRTYYRYLRHHLHRSADGKVASHASIMVKFSYAHLGHINNYLVKRSWRSVGSEILESFEIRQDGELLQDVGEDQWQDFLMELIPPRLSKLFFFDGEQIQSLAKGRDENKHVLNSINSLLGLDLVERLRSDLKIYCLKKMKVRDNDVEARLFECEKRKKELERKLDYILRRKTLVQNKIEAIKAKIEDQERQIAMEGGGYASKREQLKIQRQKLEGDIELVKEEIRDLCANLLPFAYVPDLCIALRNRLEQEEREQQRAAAVAFLNTTLDDLIKDVSKTNFLGLLRVPQEQKLEIARRVIYELRSRVNSMSKVCEIIHPLSSMERKEILRWIDVSVNHIPSHLAKLSVRLEKLVRERQKIESFLFRIPPDEVLGPLLQKLGELQKKLGAFQEQYRVYEEEARKTKNEINRVTRELIKVIEQKVQFQKTFDRLTLAARTQKVLEEYLSQLRKEKISEFCRNFLECFNFLFNKNKMIQRIDVNPDNFEISLVNDKGVVIPKSELSAGERQIYAIAMLWALARTSGRPLPFIIDTPLGRLDTEHRRRIIRRFLPNASHQVIVFSTDTEIDQLYFNELHSHISKAYHLEYDIDSGSTKVKEGYFWKVKEEILVNELQ
jgi:DNA sulfur modification protein DndD